MLNEKYLFEDVNSSDCKIKANIVSMIMNSHGSDIFGRLFLPAVKDSSVRTPVAIFLHGYPGTEQNTDMMYAFRRAGIAALHFSYRGVWGSYGDYCFSHLIEDTHAVFKHLTERADELRLDMNRVYLVGHSMGGFAALNALAEGIAVKGAVVIAPCDMGGRYINERDRFDSMMLTARKGYFRLPVENFIEVDIKPNAEKWSFINLADKLSANIPIHFIGGTQDAITPPEIHIKPLYQKLSELGRKISYTEFDDGHPFSNNRIVLTRLVFRKIAEMEKA